MTRTPPLLPDEALARVVRVARFDGLGVLCLSGLFAFMAALSGDRFAALFGLIVAGAGALELHGGALLAHGHPRGLNWLIVSQLLLLGFMLGFCAYQLSAMDLTQLRAAVTDEIREKVATTGMPLDEFLRLTYRTTYYLIGIGTLVYQGGMTWYFLRRRPIVLRALEQESADT